MLGWFCYRPAFDADFELDDRDNLGGLATVDSTETLTDFVLSGEAGPLGRPIALLTFGLQADEWNEGAEAFLRVNTGIHLGNAAILAWCLFLLARLRGIEPARSAWVAAAAAGTWLLMPILATSTMLVVQRMTTLSATFALLGLAGYLVARRKLAVAPTPALAGMSASLVLGTLLSAFTKESGLLLPVYVLVIEFALLDRPDSPRPAQWRLWKSVFLYLPTIAILAYLASRVAYPDWVVLRRDFDGTERLLTEARLLWVYLFKAAIGLPRYLGIYQGDPAIARSLVDPLTLAACLSWLGLAVAAIVTRKRFPWFAFAVLWYLAGHLIESTVVPLELYFEHRNYLPLAGPLFALSVFLLNRDGRSLRVAAAALAAFALWNAFLLHSMASLWGEPAEAARFWAGRYPDSVRAVTRYATYELATGGPGRTIDTIESFAAGHPGAAYLRIQTLTLGCATGRNQDNARIAGELQRSLPAVDFTYTAGAMLSQLFSIASRTGCKGVDSATVARLAEALHGNPRYAGDPNYNQFHYKLLAAIARSEGDIDAALANLQRAIAYRPSTELDSMMVTALAGAGRFAAAREYLDAAVRNPPRNFLKSFVRQRELKRLHRYVDALERTADPSQD